MSSETTSLISAPGETPTLPADPPVAADKGVGRARGRFRRKFWMLVFMAFALLLWGGRKPLLRGVAEGLGANAATRPVQFISLQGGGRCLTEAAAVVRAHPDCRIILFRQPHNRLLEAGVLAPAEEQARSQLRNVGVPDAACLVLKSETGSDWEHAEQLAELLVAQPGAELLILCEQYSGRRWQWIVRDTLTSSVLERVHVQSVSNEKYSTNNWWHSKLGLLEVWHGYLGLLFVSLHGREHSHVRELSADVYETNLLRSLRPNSASAVTPGR